MGPGQTRPFLEEDNIVSVQLVILAGYVLALLAVSWWSTRLLKSNRGGAALNYLLAGRNMPTPLIVVSI